MGGDDAHKGRSVRRRKQRAGVGAVLVGLAAAASATVFAGGMQAVGSSADLSSADASSRLQDWTPNALRAGDDILSAVQSVQRAVSMSDLAAGKAACQQMSDANQRLKATLPSPVPALTSEVRDFVDEIGAASSVCLNASPNPGQQNIGLFIVHLKAAQAHFIRAQQIAQGG
jgi:hypothetical protein